MWSHSNEEKRLCSLWLSDPLLNPDTGLAIERNGPTYNDWKTRCANVGITEKPHATGELTWRKCNEWRSNSLVNPDSGRRIKEGSKTYKWLEKGCTRIEKVLNLSGVYYLPDSKGMVPCALWGKRMYVAREYEGRKIWGPLNKPVYAVHLHYYKDTWDYANNHYRPIYVQCKAPQRPVNGILSAGNVGSMGPKKVVDAVVDLFVEKRPTHSDNYLSKKIVDAFLL